MDNCKSCGAPIVWFVTTSGARIPAVPKTVNVLVPTGRFVGDGPRRVAEVEAKTAWVTHFADCPDAAKHRRG